MAVLTLQGLGGGLPESIDADGGAPADSLSIGADGSVGINDMSPDGQLDIHAATGATVGLIVQAGDEAPSADLFQIRDSTEAAKVVVDSSFQIGLGIAAPTAIIHITETADTTGTFTAFQLTRLGGTSNMLTFGQAGNNNGWLSVYERGSQNIRFDSATGADSFVGNPGCLFGVGTVSPSEKFHVTTTGDANALVVQDSDGSIGVGTATPFAEVHAQRATGTAQFYAQTLDTSIASFRYRNSVASWSLENNSVGDTYLYNSSTGTFPFKIATAAPTDSLHIGTTGVGIGTVPTAGSIAHVATATSADAFHVADDGRVSFNGPPTVVTNEVMRHTQIFGSGAEYWSWYDSLNRLAVRVSVVGSQNGQITVYERSSATHSLSGLGNSVSVLCAGTTQSLRIGGWEANDQLYRFKVTTDSAYEALSVVKLDGAVGFGVAAPTEQFQVSTTGNANAITVDDATGNVGIGTTPMVNRLLHVSGGADTRMVVEGTSGSFGYEIDGPWAGAAHLALVCDVSENLVIRNTENTHSGSIYIDSENDLIFRMGGGVDRGRIDATGQLGVGAAPSDLLHITATGSADALRIDDTTGHVGINAAPDSSAKLYIEADGDSSQMLMIRHTGPVPKTWCLRPAQEGFLFLNQTAAVTPFTINRDAPHDLLYLDPGGVGINTAAPADLFHVSTTGSADAFRIDDATGDVGIGTAPTAATRLHVKDANDAIAIVESTLVTTGDATVRLVVPSYQWAISLAEANGLFRINDITASSNPFQIEQGCLNTSVYFQKSSVGFANMGLYTTTPDAAIHVKRSRGETTGPNVPSIFLEQGGTGDAAYRLAVAAQEWSLYLDNSDSDKLAIRDVTGAANVATIEPGASANSLYIDSAGEVGINTAAPADLFHVSTTGNADAIRVDDGTGNIGFGIYAHTGNNDFWFYRAAETVLVQVQTGQAGGAANLDLTHPGQSWRLSCESNSTFTISDGATTEVVSIAPGAPASSFDVDAAGDVGIGGVPVSGTRLAVVDDVHTQLRIDSSGGISQNAQLACANDVQVWNVGTQGANDYFVVRDATNAVTPFQIIPGAASQSLVIDAAGEVGFKTGTPLDLFHVSTTGSADAFRIDDATGDSAFGATPASGIRLLVSDSDIAYLKVDSTGVAKKSQVIISNDAQQWRIGCNTSDHFVIEDAIGGSTEVVKIELAAPANSLYIDSAGEVGINTAAPADLFHVNTTAGRSFRIDDATGHIGHGGEPVGTYQFLIKDSADSVYLNLTTTGVSKDAQIAYINDAIHWRAGVATSDRFIIREWGGNYVFQIEPGAVTGALYVDASSNVGLGVTSPAAKLHVDQASTAGAVPVLTLDQADTSEEFIRVIGESTTDATMSLVDAADLTTPGTLTGWIRVYVEDVAVSGAITDGIYYVPFYTAPTA